MDKNRPLVFISHKHSDSAIATAIAKFLRDKSLGAVDVFLSSDWTFHGPRLGAGLNDELRQTLWNSDALLLVYTSADQDWSYCMWECGVAAHPESPDTRIIVFQCGHESPTPFSNDLRINVRKLDDINRFAKQLLTDSEFFPGKNKPLAPNIVQETLEKVAKELFEELKRIIPEPPDGQIDEWPVWPFLAIELQQAQIDLIRKLNVADRTEKLKSSRQIIRENGVVVKSDPRASQLFGLSSLPEKIGLAELLKIWKERFPEIDSIWFDSCCDQIAVGAWRGFPTIWQSSLREVGGESDYTPVLSRVKRIPFGGKFQFELYFYNLSDPKAVLAGSRMIPAGKFFFKTLGPMAPESIRLKDLVSELKQKGLNRIPVLDTTGRPMYMVHRSMIDKYVAENVWLVPGKNPGEFTLADLLADQEMKELFENTFVVVNEQATLDEAKSAMLTRQGCSDLFITKTGKRDEPVMGWLTNVDMAKSS